jgi:hypothetical protein
MNEWSISQVNRRTCRPPTFHRPTDGDKNRLNQHPLDSAGIRLGDITGKPILAQDMPGDLDDDVVGFDRDVRGITVSMSHKGDCGDKVPMESINGTVRRWHAPVAQPAKASRP